MGFQIAKTCLHASLGTRTGNWRRQHATQNDKDHCSGTLAPHTLCFDTIWLVPNWGSGPRPLLWTFAIPRNINVSSDLRARGSVLQIEDWQLSLCKENDWLYLFLIHCYLVHMHNSCLILVVISRKYCLSLSQWNSLSRCPLKKKNLNLEKAQNHSKRKALRNNWSCQLVQLSVLQRFQGLKMLKVPDAIICYSCYHYVLVFAEININFHLYINGVSLLACFL